MKNKIFFCGFMLALLMVGMSLAAFTTTIKSPSASSTPGDDINFTVNVSSGFGELANCSMNITSSATGNTSLVIFTQQENDSGNNDFVNYSYTTGGHLEDGAYSVHATCWNSSDDSADATAVNFYIDNTLPTAPSSLTTTEQSSTSFDLTATLVDNDTTGCSILWDTFSPTSNGVSCSYATTTCTCSVSDASDGEYGYYITATDGTNETSSSVSSFTVAISSGRAGGGARAVAKAKETPIEKLAAVDLELDQKKVGIVKKQFQGKELWKTGGGVAGGALIGTFIFPGVGTILGGIGGGIIGMIF